MFDPRVTSTPVFKASANTLCRPWGLTRFASEWATAAGTIVKTIVRARRSDHAASSDTEPWTSERLKQVLSAHVSGQRLIVVSNREPLIHQWNGDGIVTKHPASGLVTALEPVMRACSGTWVAHGSGTADRQVADSNGRVMVGAGHGAYRLRRVWLTPDEERGYHYGFANEGLWPLCHRADVQPVFRSDDWAQYRRVNQRFADAVAEEAGSDDPIILVQDYHLALVPRMLKDRLPRATMVAFWHIPWPTGERFSICPYHEELLDGLLGSSIVGFQTLAQSRNFVESVDRALDVRIDQEIITTRRNQPTAVRAYPISIEWPSRWPPMLPNGVDGESIRHDLGFAPGTRIVVSVDRLDYTKGFEERLMTFERVLEIWPRKNEPLVFIQAAAPSRVQIEQYRALGDRVRALVDSVNKRFGDSHYTPIVLLNRHCPPREILHYYRAADVCYVSSLHQGMNLVAKEFAAARDDEQGVLLLSRFAGASHELTDALIVNPYEIDEVADTILVALTMPAVEQRERMRAMRAVIAAHNVYGWAGSMLVDAFRQQQRRAVRARWWPNQRNSVSPAG